jgi:hypothetical protein
VVCLSLAAARGVTLVDFGRGGIDARGRGTREFLCRFEYNPSCLPCQMFQLEDAEPLVNGEG